MLPRIPYCCLYQDYMSKAFQVEFFVPKYIWKLLATVILQTSPF